MDEQDRFVIEKDIGGFAKNAASTIRGRLTVVHGTPCGDIRCFVISATGEPVATRQGICLAREKLPELAALVAKMIVASEELAAAGGAGEPEAVRHGSGGDGEE